MTWQIEFTARARKDFRKLDHHVQKRIRRFLEERLTSIDNPRSQGRALTGKWSGFWRYRVGDFRLICEIKDNALTIVLVKLAHRKDSYE